MEQTRTSDGNQEFLRRAVEAAIRIGLLAGLAWWCFAIVKPFVIPVLWGAIFAVALFPIFGWLKDKLGGRGGLAASVLVLVALAILIVPILVLTTSMVESVQHISHGIEDGSLEIPPPPAGVADWPVVGPQLTEAWGQASANLQLFVERYREQLKPVWAFVAAQAKGAGGATVVFTLAILLSGLMMAKAGPAVAGLETIAVRLAGARGEDLVSTSGATIRSVVQGVLGVAVIQSLLAGIGMLLAGVPAAGLWAGLVLILAIMQLPPIVVLGPVMIYVFSSANTLTAVLFLIFGIIVSGSDAFLKPLFLGRGLAIPMPVILLGAIGGMMLSGIVGLFIGAVVLALGYQLLMAWVEEETEQAAGALVPETESSASSE
jgi:predicted PurR-regulated permease PerM